MNLNIAILETTLYILSTSIKENFPLALSVLINFKDRVSPMINNDYREALVCYFWEDEKFDELKVLDKMYKRKAPIDKENKKYGQLGQSKQGSNQKEEEISKSNHKHDDNILKGIELCSKILLCFNGEMNICINARIDLVLLRKICHFDDEMKFIHLICKKFRRSSVIWYYRKLIFSLILNEKFYKFDYELKAQEQSGKKDSSGCEKSFKA